MSLTDEELDAIERDARGFAKTQFHVGTEDRIWWTSDGDDGCLAECIEPQIAEPICALLNFSLPLVSEVRSLRAALSLAKSEAEAAREEIAKLQGDRCDVCDEDGLIYVPVRCNDEGDVIDEEAQACPMCNGTRSGYASAITKERDSLRTQLAEVTAQRDEAREWLYRIAVASMAGDLVTTDARDQMTPQQVLDRVVDIAANRMWLLRERGRVAPAAIRECAEQCYYADGWDECDRAIRALLTDLGIKVEG